MAEVWTEDNADGSQATITGRVLQPWTNKINPAWWLVGDDGWNVPAINNGLPYLPEVTNIYLRRFYWFFCRNPLMNFVGYVLGVMDRNYTVVGSPQVLKATGRDTTPQTVGLRWAVIKLGWVRLPFINYYNGTIEAYAGWRPASGGIGLKFIIHAVKFDRTPGA